MMEDSFYIKVDSIGWTRIKRRDLSDRDYAIINNKDINECVNFLRSYETGHVLMRIQYDVDIEYDKLDRRRLKKRIEKSERISIIFESCSTSSKPACVISIAEPEAVMEIIEDAYRSADGIDLEANEYCHSCARCGTCVDEDSISKVIDKLEGVRGLIVGNENFMDVSLSCSGYKEKGERRR